MDDVYSCPSCCSDVYEDDEYCDECGSELSWEEVA